MRNLLLIMCLLMVLAGCTEKTATDSMLNESISAEPASFDPRAQVDSETYGIMYGMFDTLVEVDDSMKAVPALSEKWETKDHKVWRFHLRKEARFHTDKCFKNKEQTRVVTAGDVVYSLNRALLPGGVGAFSLTDIMEGAEEVNAGKAPTASGLRAIDNFTVEITLKRPYRNLLERLALPFLFIVPKEAVETYGKEFGRHPVGTGPFRLDSVIPGQLIRAHKNPLYWGKDAAGKQLPYLEGINFRVIKDSQVAFTEFERGKLDAIEVPAPLARKILAGSRLAKEFQKFQLLQTDALDTHYYEFRMDKSPFKGNRLLRQALNYAINKEEISRSLLSGLATPSVGVLPPSVYPEVKRQRVYPYDISLAKKLLSEAGYPEGKGLPPLTLAIDDKESTALVAQYVQSSLASLGVRVSLRKTDFNTLLGDAGQGKLEFFYMFWEGTDPNAEIFMVQFKSDLLPEKGGYNFGHYSNPAADRLYNSAVNEMDPIKAENHWLQMNNQIVEDAPWIFLYHTRRMRLLQPGISGYDNNPMQIRRFLRTTKSESRASNGN